MYKKDLEKKLINIFGINRIIFAEPSEDKEQEVLFVNIASSNCKIKNDRILAKVEGQIIIYVNQDKLPHGFFIKKLNKASIDDTESLFFHNIDNNEQYAGAIGLEKRTVDFVYFSNASYNPDMGEITSININEGE